MGGLPRLIRSAVADIGKLDAGTRNLKQPVTD